MNILIVGPSWVGDMVMAQTLFQCLKQRHPQCEIDVLASQANIAGYKAVLVAAHHYPRFMPMLMDQVEETLKPRPSLEHDLDVDVLIIGAGYTGLWTAYYLKRLAPELNVAIVEAQTAGFGASGRNGGWLMGNLLGEDRLLAGLSVEQRRESFDLLHGISAESISMPSIWLIRAARRVIGAIDGRYCSFTVSMIGPASPPLMSSSRPLPRQTITSSQKSCVCSAKTSCG